MNRKGNYEKAIEYYLMTLKIKTNNKDIGRGRTMGEISIDLDKFIIDYKKEIEQIVDILVMGVRI